jgi:cellulose synthase/poly-beta-1,6-N-acetylglucosamine synthase-like glycosyltransferase
MTANLFVSLIIPVSKWNKNLEECIKYCLELDYSSYEIIVLPDEKFEYPDKRVVIIPTGKVGPALKRNIGVDNSKGEIIAFIDDDIFPRKDWLKNAVKNFTDPEIAAVGGPAVTPPNDSLLQQASGAVYASFLGGGAYRYRYIPGKRQSVDDFPSCNFIARREIIKQVGGFRTNFWPGEDTAICLDIVNLGKKIIYDPEVLIYHHRRSLFKGHLKQVMAYALHRGYFAKRFPKTSLRLTYFIPTLFVIFVLFGWIISPFLYRTVILTYLCLLLISVWQFENIKFLTLLGIIATHVAYGIYFVRGLLAGKLKEE